METKELKKQIFKTAHLNESSELCRQYFKEQKLQLDNFYQSSDYYKLSEYIQEEINLLLADKSYSMIRNLKMLKGIKFDKDTVCLLTKAYYFRKREAITFDLNTKFIGFCGWASGCNRIPFIKGFIRWCDFMDKPQFERM